MSLEAFDDTSFDPWWWEWAPRENRVEAELPAQADVVVVGSGFTGLMAALTLARGGREVVVLEAETIGYGASSRNNGGQARALLREGTAALEFVKSFIDAEGIDCHLRVAGRFRGASRPAHYEAMARDMADLRALTGVESHMVPRSEQGTEIGTEFYHGGCVLPGDASVHPALYHAGLVALAEAAGARLLSHTAVTGVREQADDVRVQTARGTVSARVALIATNGYTDSVIPRLYQRVVPVGSAIVATAELSPNLMAHLMPKQRVFGDTLRVHHYYQPSPDGLRVLFGGRLAGPAGTSDPRDFGHLYRDMVAVFPELDGVPITHAWSGYVGYTRDTLPHIGKQGRVYHAMGYCGSGVARASHGGHKVALQMLGRPDGATAWNELGFEAMPLRAFARIGVQVATHWKRFLDTRS